MTQDDLIELLDPNRDYGERTYDEVVGGIRAGKIRILPPSGSKHPILRNTDVPSGIHPIIKGSGRVTTVEANTKNPPATKARFMARAVDDFDSVYESMIESATQGDVRAQKLFMEMFVGRPKEATETLQKNMMDKLFEAALAPKEQVIEVVQST
tara:strand:- start:117 stop:578 length:462 start_codon:yes stop_codon:yes gene_type:complete